ncbi:hypothetical protein GF314_01475 [bacterium]|nr:hypothetical protein [bacterium]
MSDVNETPPPAPRGKPWFFISIIGGILVGAIFDHVGAGVAIGIALWPILRLLEKKARPGKRDAPDGDDQLDADR